MDWPIVLLIGIAIGWLVELLVDYFFWRPRRICPDAERVSQLESDLQERIAENAGLQAQLSVLSESRVDLNWLEKLIGRMSSFSGGSGPITVNVGATQLTALSTMESQLRGKGLDIDTFIAAFFGSELWANWPGIDSDIDFGVYLRDMCRGGIQAVDDLDLIYGIGSETEDILYEHGVLTFEQLAKMSLEALIELFREEGIPLHFFFPASKEKKEEGKRTDKWQILQQARLLARGEHATWAQLAYNLTYLRKKERLTNLELVWGIDSRLEQELYDLGITDIAQLGEASTKEIGSVLEKLKGKYGRKDVEAVHTEIKKQAELAIDEEWGQLAGYQKQFSQWDFDLCTWAIFTEDEKAKIRVKYETLDLSHLLKIRWGAEGAITTETTREILSHLKNLAKNHRWQYLEELITLGPSRIPEEGRGLFLDLVKLADDNKKKEFDELVELARAGNWEAAAKLSKSE